MILGVFKNFLDLLFYVYLVFFFSFFENQNDGKEMVVDVNDDLQGFYMCVYTDEVCVYLIFAWLLKFAHVDS